MTSLLLRYASPLMAFGHSGRFDDRPSAASPSLSAVQGLVAAAAGIGRDERWPSWIVELHIAVRVEHPGRLLTDYQTVNQPDLRLYRSLSPKDLWRVANVADADGNRKETTVVSRREWLSDATFLVAVADPTGDVASAVDRPRWHLYAGRKSAPLAAPFRLGVHCDSPEELLAAVPTVLHPTDRAGLEQVDRRRMLFRDPGTGAVDHEDRPERALGFRSHISKRRWHDTVTVPTTDSWFDLHPAVRAAEETLS